jgi:hypothetical protein
MIRDLRPGTSEHILVIAKRVPQAGDAAGALLAVDGQRDGTVARPSFDLQATGAGGAARQDDGIPGVVQRAAPASARLKVLCAEGAAP